MPQEQQGPGLSGRFEARSTVAFLVPIRTAPGQNAREVLGQRIGRVRAERDAVAVCWPKVPVRLPCTVQLTRVSPGRPLDAHDNLQGALKVLVDELARLLGVDDADPRLTWLQPLQERGPWGVWVEIVSPLAGQVAEPKPRPPPRPRRRQAAITTTSIPARLQPTPAHYPPRRPTT